MCQCEVLFAHLHCLQPTDSLAMDCPLSLTMTLGNQGGRFMITPLTRGSIKDRGSSFLLLMHIYSYLKTLLPSFNECCDKLLDGIRSQADGKTTVYMKQHLAEVTLNVISKVGDTRTHTHTHTHSHTHVHSHTCIHVHAHTQVAFGSDFSETWDDKSLWTEKGQGKWKTDLPDCSHF